MPTHDKIIISDLLIRCIIGIYEYERHNLQDVLIQITLFADLKKAGLSDDIQDTVNYKSMVKEIIHDVEQSSFFLLEALSEYVAKKCLAQEMVKGCVVRIDKPGALRFAKKVGVEIERWKD